jgi:two-component system, sensor histidine kinase YesM
MNVFSVIKNKIINIKLKNKFKIIIIFVVITIGSSAIFSCQLMLTSYNKLIYEKSAENLSALSSKIEDNLNEISNISYFIAINNTIQTNLRIIDNSDSSKMEKLNAKQAITECITSYLSNNKYIIEITIRANDGTTITYGKDSSAESNAIQKQMKTIFKENSGKNYWISTGRNDSSTLSVRTIREIKNLSLKGIGLLTIRVDFSKAINSIQNAISQDSDTFLYITTAEGIAYPINGKSNIQLKNILLTDKPYQILSVNGDKKFVVHDRMDSLNWTCITLTNYNQVFSSTILANFIFILIVIAISIMAILISNYLVHNILIHFDRLIRKIDSFKNDVPPSKYLSYDYSKRCDELGVLHRNFDNMVERINQLIEDNYVKQLLIKDTQLKILEQQIDPHFLFNTLESINWQAKSKNENQISLMVESLGSLLRYTVNEKADVVPISKELSITEDYMAIQQIRFDDRLQFSTCVDTNLLDVTIPKMSIQPLIENAIKYSLERNIDVCAIELSVVQKDQNALICVKNNGSEIDPDILNKIENKEIRPNGSGIGLTNINQRIKIIFGSDYGLSFQNVDGCANVIITVPIAEK